MPGMAAILYPVAVRKKEFQTHGKCRTFLLLTVDHASKTIKTALKRTHVNTLVGRPALFRQNARTMKAHVPRGGDLVVDEVQADQRYGHFKNRTVFRSASGARFHEPPKTAKFTAVVGTG